MRLHEIVTENKGDCYEVSGNAMIDSNLPGLKLVHAHVTGQGSLEGKRYAHAWNEIGDVVLDTSNGRQIVMPKEQYYSLGNVRIVPGDYAIYDAEEARKKLVKHEHYGPWDLDDEKADIS